MRIRYGRGFTFLEVMIVSVLSLTCIGVLFFAFSSQKKRSGEGLSRSLAESKIRVIHKKFRLEFLQSREILYPPQGKSGNEISLKKKDGSLHTFYLVPGSGIKKLRSGKAENFFQNGQTKEGCEELVFFRSSENVVEFLLRYAVQGQEKPLESMNVFRIPR